MWGIGTKDETDNVIQEVAQKLMNPRKWGDLSQGNGADFSHKCQAVCMWSHPCTLGYGMNII